MSSIKSALHQGGRVNSWQESPKAQFRMNRSANNTSPAMTAKCPSAIIDMQVSWEGSCPWRHSSGSSSTTQSTGCVPQSLDCLPLLVACPVCAPHVCVHRSLELSKVSLVSFLTSWRSGQRNSCMVVHLLCYLSPPFLSTICGWHFAS